MPQYAKPLTLNKGVDNRLQFQFLNQEQKPVDITGKEISFRIIDSTGTTILLEKALTLDLPLTGLASLYTSPSDLEDLDAQKCFYSLEIPIDQFNFPVFVDQNSRARGDLYIVNSVLPSFLPSQPVSIPTSQQFPNTNPNSSPNTWVYYSSVLETNENPIISLQATLSDYSGNILIQGSTISDSDWYNVSDNFTYANANSTIGLVVEGYHPYIRMQFSSNSGEVSNILAR